MGKRKLLDHEAMRKYYAEGHTSKETAEKFGTTREYASRICKGIRSGNQYTNGLFDREANAIRYIAERTPNFEYAGNFTGVDGYVDLKCKTCGTVIRKSFVTVKHGKTRCNVCYKREQERKKADVLKEKERRLAEKEVLRKEKEEEKKHKLFSKNTEQAKIAVCKCCGSMFFKTGRRTKYCSDECMKKTLNAKTKDKRIRRIKGVVIDSDITLEKLYKRDNGICHICGGICDWDDCDIREGGTFVANNNYPSIDHIVPLTKGGLHSWLNIKLAHRVCNTKKGNRIASRTA